VHRFISVCALALLATACNKNPPAPAATASPEDQFATLEHEYSVYIMGQFPVVATYLGGSAFDPSLANIDGKLRDHSAAALGSENEKLKDFRKRFEALPEANLEARRKIDRSVALAQIDFLLRQHETRKYQERSLDSYLDEPFRGVDWQIQGMTETGAGTYGTDAEWRAVIARAQAVPQYMKVAQDQLTAGIADKNFPDWRVLTEFGLKTTSADAEYFAKTLPEIAGRDITGPQHDELVKNVQEAGAQASKAYNDLRTFIAQTFFADAKATDVNALKPEFRGDQYVFGETEYDWALKNNLRMQKTAAQLYDESWPIVEQTRAQMIELATQIATAHKWKFAADKHDVVRVVFDKLSDNAPKTDAEMIEAYRTTGVRLVDYARKTGLFAVPADYKLDVTITPPPLRAGIDGAAYYPAPPFKKTGVGRFYVTPTNDDPALLKELHNKAALPDLAAHEGFPGHDWHYKVLTENQSQISPVRWLTPGAVEDSSSMWEDSMAAEGWALYSEALIAEPQPNAPNGFYTPEERLYQLKGLLYRDLRVRIDTGLHLGKLKFDDAVTLFSEVVDFVPGSCSDAKATRVPSKQASCKSALAAIHRYARWPTQAITYRLGKDQIQALRARAEKTLGDKFLLERFHVEFMKQGTIPAGYFADELLNTLSQAH
jgi:uncharacterized protein (DUF885 family)